MQTMLIKQECSYEYTIIHLFTTVTDAWNQSWTVYQTRLDYIPNDIVTINEVKSQVLLPCSSLDIRDALQLDKCYSIQVWQI
jgi:hypothetical protein